MCFDSVYITMMKPKVNSYRLYQFMTLNIWTSLVLVTLLEGVSLSGASWTWQDGPLKELVHPLYSSYNQKYQSSATTDNIDRSSNIGSTEIEDMYVSKQNPQNFPASAPHYRSPIMNSRYRMNPQIEIPVSFRQSSIRKDSFINAPTKRFVMQGSLQVSEKENAIEIPRDRTIFSELQKKYYDEGQSLLRNWNITKTLNYNSEWEPIQGASSIISPREHSVAFQNMYNVVNKKSKGGLRFPATTHPQNHFTTKDIFQGQLNQDRHGLILQPHISQGYPKYDSSIFKIRAPHNHHKFVDNKVGVHRHYKPESIPQMSQFGHPRDPAFHSSYKNRYPREQLNELSLKEFQRVGGFHQFDVNKGEFVFDGQSNIIYKTTIGDSTNNKNTNILKNGIQRITSPRPQWASPTIKSTHNSYYSATTPGLFSSPNENLLTNTNNRKLGNQLRKRKKKRHFNNIAEIIQAHEERDYRTRRKSRNLRLVENNKRQMEDKLEEEDEEIRYTKEATDYNQPIKKPKRWIRFESNHPISSSSQFLGHFDPVRQQKEVSNYVDRPFVHHSNPTKTHLHIPKYIGHSVHRINPTKANLHFVHDSKRNGPHRVQKKLLDTTQHFEHQTTAHISGTFGKDFLNSHSHLDHDEVHFAEDVHHIKEPVYYKVKFYSCKQYICLKLIHYFCKSKLGI